MWCAAKLGRISKVAVLSLAWVAIAQAQVLSRLGAVSDDAPGVQSVFEGNWIYSLSSSKLVITLEANPAIIKRGALPFPGGRQGYGTAIAKSGNYLYVGNDSIMPSRSYLTIVDVSNPAAPSIVADMAMPSGVPSTLQIQKRQLPLRVPRVGRHAGGRCFEPRCACDCAVGFDDGFGRRDCGQSALHGGACQWRRRLGCESVR